MSVLLRQPNGFEGLRPLLILEQRTTRYSITRNSRAARSGSGSRSYQPMPKRFGAKNTIFTPSSSESA